MLFLRKFHLSTTLLTSVKYLFIPVLRWKFHLLSHYNFQWNKFHFNSFSNWINFSLMSLCDVQNSNDFAQVCNFRFCLYLCVTMVTTRGKKWKQTRGWTFSCNYAKTSSVLPLKNKCTLQSCYFPEPTYHCLHDMSHLVNLSCHLQKYVFNLKIT